MRRQDRLPVSLYYLGFSRVRDAILRLRGMPVVRILAFHDIADHLASQFRAQMMVLSEHTNVISLDDLFAGRVSTTRTNVAITFDDGYRSWVDHVAPALRELGLPATFFVSSGLVGRSPTDQFVRERLRLMSEPTGCLDVDGIRRLARDGFTIGGHTRNHINIEALSDEAHLRSELLTDKAELERMTGTRVHYFAYPFGCYENPRLDVMRILQSAGYRGAVTTISGANDLATNPYLLRRDLVNPALPMVAFQARVFGNHDPVMFVRRALRL